MSEAALAEVGTSQVMCSKFVDQPAIALFTWPWGESGACCPQYQAELRMVARNLNRDVAFSPLPTPPSALTRDERVQFHAQIISAEEELKASRAHGMNLYNENSTMADEVRRLRARNTFLEGALGDAQKSYDAAVDERDELLAQAGEAHQEVQRLNAVLGRETQLQTELEAAKKRIAELEA